MSFKNIIYSIFCLASINSGFCSAEENHLKLFSDQEEKRVSIPFSYKDLTEEEKKLNTYGEAPFAKIKS